MTGVLLGEEESFKPKTNKVLKGNLSDMCWYTDTGQFELVTLLWLKTTDKLYYILPGY